jgi:hypothetical protein
MLQDTNTNTTYDGKYLNFDGKIYELSKIYKDGDSLKLKDS